jgi:hypothetical protein
MAAIVTQAIEYLGGLDAGDVAIDARSWETFSFSVLSPPGIDRRSLQAVFPRFRDGRFDVELIGEAVKGEGLRRNYSSQIISPHLR